MGGKNNRKRKGQKKKMRNKIQMQKRLRERTGGEEGDPVEFAVEERKKKGKRRKGRERE